VIPKAVLSFLFELCP